MKILIVKCAKCNRITAGIACLLGSEEMIGESIIVAADRGDMIEIIDSPVTLQECECREVQS